MPKLIFLRDLVIRDVSAEARLPPHHALVPRIRGRSVPRDGTIERAVSSVTAVALISTLTVIDLHLPEALTIVSMRPEDLQP